MNSDWQAVVCIVFQEGQISINSFLGCWIVAYRGIEVDTFAKINYHQILDLIV